MMINADTAQSLSPMAAMASLPAQWWNDSCDPDELAEAIAKGATGATSNPVIVRDVITKNPAKWAPEIERLAHACRELSDMDLTWRVIETIARLASKELLPLYESSRGLQGLLNLQVDPTLNDNADAMACQARRLADLAPNIAIKIPCTAAGLVAAETLVAEGIRINTTVSFTLPQAVAAAQAIDRGLAKAEAKGIHTDNHRSFVTLMIGRLDDYLKALQAKSPVSIPLEYLDLAGIAVFKKTALLFQQRGYRATLLAAAYRHIGHWSEIIGPHVAQTIPYPWWKRFDTSSHSPEPTLQRPVDPQAVQALRLAFPAFEAAYREDGIPVERFATYGASQRTLEQFISGYRELIEFIARARRQA